MNELKKLQKISMWLRYLVIFISLVVVAAIIFSYVVYDHWIVSFNHRELNQLWRDPTIESFGLWVIITPITLTAILGVYWLQRLFGEYQKGVFFTPNNMKCYLWLIWLKAFHFLYYFSLPYLLQFVPGRVDRGMQEIVIDISSFFGWLLLICIVYLLKMAQTINNENKEFI